MKNINRWYIWVFISMSIIFVGTELFARYYLGLGTPPLSVFDPQIEYLFKPNQDVYRFNNHIIINQYGMRSPSFSQNRSTEDEIRIMIFGDSVLNGGNLTDHAELATTRLQDSLTNLLQIPIVVGNISAGSWGPGNWLAYSKKYGFFDADIIILVISSHDYADNPTFDPLDPNTHPTKKPLSALSELTSRYLPRYLPQPILSNKDVKTFDSYLTPGDEKQGLQDLRDFLVLAKNNAQIVLVFQHWEKQEVEIGKAQQGNQLISEVCESLGILPIQLMPYFLESIQSGNDPYRDNIHLNKLGQSLIGQAFLEGSFNYSVHKKYSIK